MVARANVKLAADGTADYRLKLPKGTKAGRYTLKATYKTITRVTEPHADRQDRRPGASSLPGVDSGRRTARAPRRTFHGDRPARTFKVV